MEQVNWTSRSFNFDFPAGMFPVIIARLQGVYAIIKFITRNISQQKLIQQINNKWSIQQHIGHLIDLEELHSARIIDFRNNATVLSAWDGLNIKTEQANHNAKNIDDILNELHVVRKEFISKLLKFSDDDLIKTSLHPRLQKQMRVIDMAYFVAEHDDHHIAKIFELKEKLK
ncbi:MAG: DinB family protein [Fimbriimonadaceae bacterium]|nr:DinB family protein [Chitinophagales bacterium]